MTAETTEIKNTIETEIFELNDQINSMRENMRVGEIPDSDLLFSLLTEINKKIEQLDDTEAVSLRTLVEETRDNLQLLSDQMGEISKRLYEIQNSEENSPTT